MDLKAQRIAAVLVVCFVLAGCSGTDTQTTPIETTTMEMTDEQIEPTDSGKTSSGGGNEVDKQPCKQSPSGVKAATPKCDNTSTQVDTKTSKTGTNTDTDPDTATESETVVETRTRTQTETSSTDAQTKTSSKDTQTETSPRNTLTETSTADTGTQARTQTEYDCSDFSTQAAAQNVFNDHKDDIYRLDADDDGQACESLPTKTETGTETPSNENENTVASPIDGGTARKAVVTRVIDGDTVEVRFTNGEVDTIRLIGVDTPETSLSNQDPSEYGIPDTQSGRDWLLQWGKNAESFAKDALAGTEVTVVTDPESDTRGSYGRLLAYIYSDGENFGRTLLERGYARVYTDAEFTLENEYTQAESTARDTNKGLWAYDEEHTTPTPTPTPVETSRETETLTPTPTSTSTPTPTETPSEVVTPPLPANGDYDCGHFDTQRQAQEVFNDNADDVYRLDGDGDGQACESLP